MKLIYLHGFRSSPASTKAKQLQNYLQARGLLPHLHCPQLPPSPREAIDTLTQYIEQTRNRSASPLCVIGSSLGGYYATYLAERFDSRAVLINPSIYAPRDLSTQLAVTTQYYSDEPFHFTAQHIQELAQLYVPQLSKPERYLLLAGMADEVLDWREMSARYQGSEQIIVPGQDHSFPAFADYIEKILDFAWRASA